MQNQLKKLIKLTQLLGVMINVEKSELNSTQIDIHNLLKAFGQSSYNPLACHEGPRPHGLYGETGSLWSSSHATSAVELKKL